MNRTPCLWLACLLVASASGWSADFARRDLNTPRTFPAINSRSAWEARARQIREQVLVSSGLWPLPERTPLRPEIYGRLDRDGYSIEKVYFQTSPGFYLAGNLYRPLGKGRGPFPGVLIALGHWNEGRLVDSNESSAPALGVSFARQGMIAFSYDMVGYNDTRFADSPEERSFSEIHHMFLVSPTNQLWNISPMGLQTWNSLRALDFLEALPGVDKRRLACTGASGGGTQTFMLGAIDDRLAAQAPVCMVSHTMQGGCSCENEPALRVDFSNMELAASVAPRPQILVAATGDWTKTMMEVEGPAIGKIYGLVGKPDALNYVRFDFGHNYNQTSREAVYDWFGQRLLKHPDLAALKEQPHPKERDEDVRVFPKGKLPADALTSAQYIASQEERHRQAWARLQPDSRKSYEHFKSVVEPLWEHTLLVSTDPAAMDATFTRHRRTGPASPEDGAPVWDLELKHASATRTLGARLYEPKSAPTGKLHTIVILADDSANRNDSTAITQPLLAGGVAVVVLTNYSTVEATNQFANFFTTYNRTKVQERVRDLVALSDPMRSLRLSNSVPGRVVFCGAGPAGIWSLLAAPAADAVVADCGGAGAVTDAALLDPDLFCPGLRNIGTFEGAAMLAAPHPMLLHNLGNQFPTERIQAAYRALGASRTLRIETRKLSDQEVAAWIAGLD